MAILSVNKKLFEKDIGKLDEKMQGRIAMFGTPVEAVDEEKVDIEIFPNRPDLLSYQNFKHSFLAFLGKKTGLRKIKVNKFNGKLIVDKSTPKEWPYAIACVVKGLKFDDEKIKEIIDIQEKLGATLLRKRKKGGIGLYPLEKISFPIKFKGMSPDEIKFRPLEFPEKITGRQILSKHPTGREYAHLVQGWKSFPVFIDNKNQIMSMPPIINSHDLGKIDETTKDVFIEATGTDINVLKSALNIIVCSLEGMGGQIYSLECIQTNGKKENIPNLEPQKMIINKEKVNKLLGLNLNDGEIKKLLEKMGYDVSGKNVLVPAYRIDVLHEVDLIEDIAIAYGYDNLIPEIPHISTIGEQDEKEIMKKKCADILSGLGLLETLSYHLTTKDDQIKNTGLNTKPIEVLNSKTEYNILRYDLSHYMLKILAENVDVEYPHEIFQIGTVFHGLDEKEHLAIAFAPGNFTKTKQVLDYLAKMLNLKFEYKVPKQNSVYFIEGRAAEVVLNGKTIGLFGEVHPKLLKNFKIKMPVTLCELDFSELIS